MLKQIKLTNFRKHESLEINFDQGLVVTRSPNEGGKSTIVEAIAYALFGSSALRSSIDDVATYGKPASTVRVELTLADGHVFSRGKSGAEVHLNGSGSVIVTGQKEVSAFAAELIGADAQTASLLMFSAQGSLRGTLDNGAKATGGLIETLANFDLFDTLIERAQERLPLGSTALYEERLKGLKATQDALTMPAEPNGAELQTLKQQYAAETLTHEADLVKLREQSPVVEKEMRVLEERQRAVEKLSAGVAASKRDLESARIRQAALPAPSEDASETISELEKRLLGARETKRACDAHARWVSWEKAHLTLTLLPLDFDTVTKALHEATATVTGYTNTIVRLEGDIRVQEARRVTAGTCPTCGSDMRKSERVQQINAEVDAKIASCRKEIDSVKADLSAVSEKITTYEQAMKQQNALAKAIGSDEEFFTIDESYIPNNVYWRGEPPVLPNVAGIERQLSELRARQSERERVLSQSTMLARMMSEAIASITDLERKIVEIGFDSARLSEAISAYSAVLSKIYNLESRIDAMCRDIDVRQAAFDDQLSKWQTVKQQALQIATDIAKTESDIASVGFNNNLMKRIRAARPVVSNKLWSLVLTSVSTLFSSMRGENSIVTRGDKSFLVNNQAVESLSGSTLDILGLAIRIALLRCFVPGCSLFIADEPGSGCDAARTEALVGFMASCGVDQVILITHEDTSTAFASQIIEV